MFKTQKQLRKRVSTLKAISLNAFLTFVGHTESVSSENDDEINASADSPGLATLPPEVPYVRDSLRLCFSMMLMFVTCI